MRSSARWAIGVTAIGAAFLLLDYAVQAQRAVLPRRRCSTRARWHARRRFVHLEHATASRTSRDSGEVQRTERKTSKNTHDRR